LYQSQQKLRQASINLITNKIKIKVRNCSKIPFEVQQVLAKRIVNYLIRQDPERKYKFVCVFTFASSILILVDGVLVVQHTFQAFPKIY
jgi:hypothetical protein